MLEALNDRIQQQQSISTVFYLNQYVSEFTGDNEDRKADEWLNSSQMAADLHDWLEAYKIEAAHSRLVGPAQDWYLTNQNKLRTKSEFLMKFQKMFRIEV